MFRGSTVNKRICFGALLIGGMMAVAVADDGHHAPAAASQTVGVVAHAEGEVIELDLPNKRVLVKHEEIKSINMKAMTMPFVVKDERLFARLKPGGRIRFTTARIDGAYTILTVEEGR
jgi:Cu/Ag efflux protein CusF